MAAVLQEQGIKKGDHVLLKCTQNINYLVIFSALQYIRALVIPVEKGTKPERITEIAEWVDAHCVIADIDIEGIRTFQIKERCV